MRYALILYYLVVVERATVPDTVRSVDGSRLGGPYAVRCVPGMCSPVLLRYIHRPSVIVRY